MQRRLFIAINLPERAVHEIDAEVAALEPLFKNAPMRFLRPETWHLTLTFLGGQDDEAVGEIVHAVEETAADSSVFPVRLTKLLYGPPGRAPRMIWLGADTESTDRLAELKTRLDEALRERDVRIEEAERRFEGHLTLARFSGPMPALPPLDMARPIEFEALSLDLMESLPGDGGPRYDCLGSVPFNEIY
ncbi:MAG: RNA 2',3'-cyclic phosphodiesterase [Candidatus Liptonbacteria bacterium]|nr:RNA 2',3'-cyclic phosphodiesterase [Candidatus Liptonbacteria bacterium]